MPLELIEWFCTICHDIKQKICLFNNAMMMYISTSKPTIQPTMMLRMFLLLVIPMGIAKKVHPAGNIHRGLNDDNLNCVVHELGAIAMPGKEGNEKLLSCSAENFGPTVQLSGNNDAFFSGKNLLSGVTSMTIPTNLVSASLSVDLDDPLAAKSITVSDGSKEKRGTRRRTALRGGRNLSRRKSIKNGKTGSYSVLVVRVSDKAGHSPTYSARQISDSIFNGNVSMANGYRTCSNNQLNFYKARGGSDVKNGVVDIVVDQDLSGAYDSNICLNAADAALSSSAYDVGNSHSYTMYICPDVVEFGQAAGVAQMGGRKSWFRDKWGSYPFVQMHEIGHNLMFFHSSEGKLEYGDPTGIMGGSYEKRQDWGKMCFNAAKTYHSGWHSQYHANIDPMSNPYIGSLVDVNSVFHGNARDNNDVVVRIQSGTDEETLYFMLHRLEGITSDMVADFVPTHANRVNIISERYYEGVPSQNVRQLADGEEYVRENWAGTGKDLHIKVCYIAEHSAVGGAKVIAYLEGETIARCSMADIEPPTPSPSKKPSVIQTTQPTVTPSMSPSVEEKTCTDSPLKMVFPNGTKRDCAWVAKGKNKDRCLLSGVASHCPVTCGTCIECVDSGKRFQMLYGDIKSCAWVKKKNTKNRCAMKDVANSCRATCGTCN